MRSHLEILDDIDKILSDNNLLSEKKDLENEIRASSTGGELCSRSGSKLLSMQRNKKIEGLIGHLIKEFISYCNASGIYPHEIQ